MNRRLDSEQEVFWKGEFGDSYISRNKSSGLLSSNINLFKSIFSKTKSFDSILELGANIGMNMQAINKLNSKISLSAIEINSSAYKELEKLNYVEALHGSIIDLPVNKKYDFVFSKGVLIHLSPDLLTKVYEKIYSFSKRYICLIEYYNPTPVNIPYRGHENKLFKRDFAGEIMEIYNDLALVDYGFVYHKDPKFPQDDLTWFLLEK